MHTSWVQSIDIDAQIHWLLGSDTVSDLLDDAIHTDSVNFSGFNNLKAAVPIVIIVAKSGEGCAYTGVDVGVVCKEALFVRMVEVGTVIDRGLLCGSTSEDFGPPCIAEK